MLTTRDPSSSHTNWALIMDASNPDAEHAAHARERLVRRYWPAVYAYIRRTGRTVDDAAELTQGFVCDVILGNNLFGKAKPAKGSFRAFLLTCLKNFLREQHRDAHAAKRSPRFPGSGAGAGPGAAATFQMRDADLADADPHPSHSPEQAFSAQWARRVVHRVLDRVHRDCLAGALEVHWRVFEARIARPMLTNQPSATYASLVNSLALRDAAQAANMMITVKRRFARAMLQEVAHTVSNPKETEDELRALLRDLEAPR